MLFAITVSAGILLFGSLVVSSMSPSLRVWPPPQRQSWQYYYTWSLTAVLFLGGLALGVIHWNRFAFDHWLRVPAAVLLILGGLGFAGWGMKSLSLHTSLGLEGPFVQAGAYRHSRNPQYVGDIALLLGYGILCNSAEAWIACLFGIAWFTLAPFAEEPWLRERFGTVYDDYTNRVPRFIRW